MSNIEDRRDNCKFSRARASGGVSWHDCRKRSPIASPEDAVAWWPIVQENDSCGDHKRKFDGRVSNATD